MHSSLGLVSFVLENRPIAYTLSFISFSTFLGKQIPTDMLNSLFEQKCKDMFIALTAFQKVGTSTILDQTGTKQMLHEQCSIMYE